MSEKAKNNAGTERKNNVEARTEKGLSERNIH